jgi:hypothetical protein
MTCVSERGCEKYLVAIPGKKTSKAIRGAAGTPAEVNNKKGIFDPEKQMLVKINRHTCDIPLSGKSDPPRQQQIKKHTCGSAAPHQEKVSRQQQHIRAP